VDRIRKCLVSSAIWRHLRVPQQTQRSRASTNGELGSRHLAENEAKTERSQFIIKLDAMVAAVVAWIVSETAAANECNR